MSGKTYLVNQPYFKPNYYEAVKYIIPKYLTEDDIESFGQSVDIKDLVINSHIRFSENIDSVLLISSIENTSYSSMSSIEGIAPYFVKQNNLTDITLDRFERNILNKLGRSFSDFKTSSAFYTYISESLLPSIQLNAPTASFGTNYTSEDNHIHLIQNLSWMYFLNTTGTVYDPSSFVASELTSKLFRNVPILLNDALKGLSEYLWKNNYTDYYPSSLFASSTEYHLSGTQQLDKLKTWIDIVYSPLHSDRGDFSVRNRFEDYIDSKVLTEDKIESGPFSRFLRALSFFAYDISDINEKLSTLYDLEECPDEYLPLLAQLIGWDLFGSDPDRWRLQLRNAVSVYKAAGTKKGFQLAMNSIFPKGVFPIETYITELYESYIPYLIYYSLATESSFFSSINSLDPTIAQELGLSGYSSSSIDENIRLAVDTIMYQIYTAFPDNFKPFPGEDLGYLYRGRVFPIPPFEEYPYYVNFELNESIIRFIQDRLVCFGVNKPFASEFYTYVSGNALADTDEIRSSSFLFFTSGYNQPPNFESLIADLDADKFEYASLWSGKSSHFKVVLDAESYNFDNIGLNLNSPEQGDTIKTAARITRKFAPAHSIPLINLQISYYDPVDSINSDLLPLIVSNKVEVDTLASSNYYVSGLNLNSYKRGVNPTGNSIGRSLTEVNPTLFQAGVDVGDIPRNTIRRRSYEKVMPFNGYYDRTGFNMPTTFDMTEEVSGVQLGLIPSSMQFVPIPDAVNLHPIWSICEDLDSKNSYYEYSVSNTFASRGGRPDPSLKNLIIFAGQSNINGRGKSAREDVNGVNWWNLDTSSFTDTLIPFVLTDVDVSAGSTGPVGYRGDNWGPEVRFCELIKQNQLETNNLYLFKFATDNSWVIDPTAENVGSLSSSPLVPKIQALEKNTWCPSSSQPYNVFIKFIDHLNLVISDLGGVENIGYVYFIWNQGETEAGRGQVGDSIALQHREATEYLFDNIRPYFNGTNLKFLRVKINENMSLGSEADWAYYPSGLYSDPSGSVDLLYGDTSNPGWYGNWSWSSTNIVRAGQEISDATKYGRLLNVDDIPITSDDGSTQYMEPIEDSIALVSPPLSALIHYNTKLYTLDNIHYTDNSIDRLGERLFYAWSTEIGPFSDVNKRDVKNDRGQLPDIYAVMHSIQEKIKLLQASSIYGEVTPYINSVSNVYASYANMITASGGFPNSTLDYYNFSFGRDLHKLYTIYTSEFENHRLNSSLETLDGANIISHVFGPTLYNHDFEELGVSLEGILVSSLSAATALGPNSTAFNGALAYNASDPSDMYLDTYEKVLSGVVSGVELVHTSGSLNSNVFSVFRLDGTLQSSTDDPYLYDNTLILSKSTIGGLPRVRFNLKKYDSPSTRPISTNFLLPDHKYKIDVKALVANDKALGFGGRQIGVWVHTAPEGGKMWSFTKNHTWEQHDALTTKNAVIRSLSHIYDIPFKTKEEINETEIIRYPCIDVIRSSDPIAPVARLRKEDFVEMSLNFHTSNRELLLSKEYRSNFSLLHRKDQNYIVEVFLVPNGADDKFMLLDTVKIQDMTMKEMSEIFVNGHYLNPLCFTESPTKNCIENRVPLSKDEILKVFRFFNDISGKNSSEGLASRNVSETETIMGTDGGSKLDYRYTPSMLQPTLSIGQVINQVILDV